MRFDPKLDACKGIRAIFIALDKTLFFVTKCFWYFFFNSFGAKFQTTFVVCCFYLNKLSFGKTFICKVERLNVKQRRSRWDGSMSRLIWIYAVCKSLLLSPVAVKELICHANICCCYAFIAPCRDAFDEYQEHTSRMFAWWNKKNIFLIPTLIWSYACFHITAYLSLLWWLSKFTIWFLRHI